MLGANLASKTEGFVANPGGSQENLCLGGKIGRFNASAKSSGPLGRFSISVDLTNLPPPPQQAVQSCETWNWQAWFRDKNPNLTSNFTDGVAVGFR